MQILTRCGDGDAAAGLGLHFLHMSEGPFSHDAGKFTIPSSPSFKFEEFSYIFLNIFTILNCFYIVQKVRKVFSADARNNYVTKSPGSL